MPFHLLISYFFLSIKNLGMSKFIQCNPSNNPLLNLAHLCKFKLVNILTKRCIYIEHLTKLSQSPFYYSEISKNDLSRS